MAEEKLSIGGREVILNSDNLKFSDATLNQYIQTESGFYDYFGACLAMAERDLQNKDLCHEKLFADRFTEAKDCGGSDKYAEATAKKDPEVVDLKQKCVDAKYIVKRLQQHLRAWDKNHDNAQSLGHMLRKTMDKLNAEIISRAYRTDTAEIPGLDDAVQETCPPVPKVVDVDVADDAPVGFADDLGISDLI